MDRIHRISRGILCPSVRYELSLVLCLRRWLGNLCTHTYTYSNAQSRSFSLLYSGRSLDIICKDKKEFETWTTGIEALMNGFADRNAVEAYMSSLTQRRQTRTLKEDKIKVALGTMRTKVVVQESKSTSYQSNDIIKRVCPISSNIGLYVMLI